MGSRRVRLGLTARLMIATAVLAVIVIGAFVVLALALRDERRAAEQSDESQRVLIAANVLERLVLDLETGQRGFIITGQDRFLEPWNEARARLPAATRNLGRRTIVPIQHRRAQGIADAIDSYVDDYSVPLVRAVRAGDPTADSTEATDEGKQRVDALRTRFDRLLTTERELAVARAGRVRDATERASIASIVGLAGSALLIVGFGVYMARAIVLPLRRASVMAGRLAGGDLGARMSEDGIGEIGTLQRSFNAMAGSLEQSRAELAASRARVVAASDETRRRIERDLHDGVQQRLVSLGLDLRAAQSELPPGNRELEAQLERAANGLTVALEDLHEMSRGIHPAILSKGGLVAALRNLARRSAVPVELRVTSERTLPESVDVAAYYVVSEALTNAAKHARASVVEVEVDAGGAGAPSARLTIRDDGVGGADPGRGSGLVGLRDRVEAIGGTLEITSPPGEGTTLVVTLPADSR